MEAIKLKRWHKIALACLGAGFIVGGVALYIYNLPPTAGPGEQPVVVQVLPKGATITASNGKVLRNGYTNYLPSGQYSVTVSHPDYITQQIKITVKQGLWAKVITPLKPAKPNMKAFSDADLGVLERASVRASAEYSNNFREKNPAITKLPFTDPYFKIGYISKDGSDFIITVRTESPRYRENAIKKLISLGIDPSRYKITFINYQSPLKEAQQ